MTTVLATIALAVAPMLDELAELAAHPRHHHQHHQQARRADPPPAQTATASYYNVGGASTACGFSAPNGVANRTLPCGTHVRICAQRCVVAVVDDRGPFVAGRLFDLSSTLAQALGFDTYAGVGPVRWALT